MRIFLAFVLNLIFFVLPCIIAESVASPLDYSNNKPSQRVGNPSSILVTSDDIWIGGENGLLKVRENLKVDFDEYSQSTNWVTDLAELSPKHLLVSVFGHGIFVLNMETLQLTEVNPGSFHRKGFWKVSVGAEVIAASTLNDISVFDKAKMKFKFSLVEEGVRVGSKVVDLIVDDSDSTLWWIDSERGLYNYSLSSKKWGVVELGNSADYEYFSLEKYDDSLYIGTDKGLLIYDLISTDVALIEERDSSVTPVQPVRSTLLDQHGTLWVAAEKLYELDGAGKRLIANGVINTSADSNRLLIVTDMTEDQLGNIYAVDTVNGLIAFSRLTSATTVINNISGSKEPLRISYAKNSSQIVIEYPDSVSLLENIDKLAELTPTEFKPLYGNEETYFVDRYFNVFQADRTTKIKTLSIGEKVDKEQFFSSVLRMYQLDKKVVYLISQDEKLKLVEASRDISQFFPYEISNDRLTKDETIIVTVDAVGVFEIDSKGRVFRYALGLDHSYHVFTAIYTDDEIIGIGTSGNGAFFISRDTKSLETKYAYPKFIRDISTLANYWLLATNSGAYAIGKEHNEKILIGSGFGVTDGDFSFGGIAESESEMILLGDKQAYQFKTLEFEKILSDLSSAKHAVPESSLLISTSDDGRWGRVSQSEIILQKGSSLKVKVPAINYLNRAIHSYQYRIAEREENWKTLEAEHLIIVLDKLNSGKYVLEMRVNDPRSYAEQPVTAITLHVLPPWWRSWQAMIAYTLALLVLGFVSYRNYLRRVGEQGEMLSRMVDEKNTALEDSGTFLNQVLSQRQRIMANLSHEIRTPLSLVIGPLSQMLKAPDDPEMPALLDTANRNANRIRVLVDQMLELEKLDYVRSRPKQHYDLDKDVPKIIYDLKPFAEAKDQTLVVKCSTGKSISLYEDTLEKILNNLVSNAVKYTRTGGNISVRITQRAMQLLIEVSDNGQGIPDEKKEKIFERYTQLDKSKDGVGVGLALVKELVTVNDGHIKLESEVEQGTCVRVWLPLLNTEYEQKAANASVAAGEPQSPGYAVNESAPQEDKLILVVDDNEELRRYLHKQISGQYHCLVADSAKQALDVSARMRPDLILTDFKMPEMDGLELTQEVRERFDDVRIPVIVMSAFGDPQSIRDALAAGVDSYLTKPVETELLLLRIRNVLERQQIQTVEISADSFESEVTDLPDFVSEREQNFYFKFMDILEAHHADEHFNKAAMASEMAVSERQLSRVLRTIFDKTFIELLKEFRLERAKQLLAEGKQVTQVGLEVGFSSPSQFSRTFREVNDTTPTQYQQEHAKPARKKG